MMRNDMCFDEIMDWAARARQTGLYSMAHWIERHQHVTDKQMNLIRSKEVLNGCNDDWEYAASLGDALPVWGS